MVMDVSQNWYEDSFLSEGFSAQRKYPNEELCRFMGRNFFSAPMDVRRNTKILEVGCGSGANLWMVAREGFQAYGIDFSASAISLAENMLKSYGSSALLSVQNMLSMSFESAYFDGVVDVFSSYCMGAEDGDTFLSEVFRVLKPGGVFFSYFPSKASDAFGDHHPAVLIDADTLSGVYRETSPFAGNHYPFRFMTLEEYQNKLENYGFTIKYSEKVGRTYRNGEEYFEWLTIEARKTPA